MNKRQYGVYQRKTIQFSQSNPSLAKTSFLIWKPLPSMVKKALN
ncbi:hypothetical protein HOLDEFILI_01022 [Holdemania filiformis DSM 12042]|uniref:Uncharacterized protein n=1 Tax=Holdemania filiformis DSM 12042 TaxID=545696 RepID=B9Y5E0_9FIRM|nr:hypothetical protein HOLDEFILI_01022 [Holdemania filiformis DSM 12042]